MTQGEPLPAGPFSDWLTGMTRALRGEADASVPCGGCTACCRSSQFVHIEPDERDTLAHIPTELLFPAPRLPIGHVLMGYDEHGHCPMLVDDRCSIYEHRPRTCRTYDCRVFAATGITLDDEAHVDIATQAQRWRFDFSSDADRVAYDAVRAAAQHLDEQASDATEQRPANATQRAVLAVERSRDYLDG
jgi:uncharacterized protein